LNKKNENSEALRRFISPTELKFLDFDEKQMSGVANDLKILKNKFVKAQKYEAASRVKDAQIEFTALFVRTFWPETKPEFLKPFYKKFRSELLQSLNHENLS